MRALVRRGRHRAGLHAEELAVVLEALALPRLADDGQRLREARLALAVGHAEHVVGARRAAATHAELEAALAHVIERRHVLGNAQRMVERQQVHGGADAEPPRAAGDGGGHDQRRGEHGARDVEVDLAQPDPVETPGLRRLHELERVLEGAGRGAAGARFLEEDPDVHVGWTMPQEPAAVKVACARLRAMPASIVIAGGGLMGLSAAFWSRWKHWLKICAGYLSFMCFVGILLTGSRGGCLSSIGNTPPR